MRLAIAVLASVALAGANAPRPSAEIDAPLITEASLLDTYLRIKKSPMAGLGTVLIENAREYGVDPRLIVAIAGAETGFGARTCGAFNAWNWFWCLADRSCVGKDPCQGSPFASWDDGITAVTRGLQKSYLSKGLTTIPAIRRRYCAAGCENWVSNVTTFYARELGGLEDDLGY